MADRGGIFIRIAGGVQANTIKSIRNLAQSFSRLGAAARGLEKTSPGRGLDSTIQKIKKFHSSTTNSINGIINSVERYKRSASDLATTIKSQTSSFKVLSTTTDKARKVGGAFKSEMSGINQLMQNSAAATTIFDNQMKKTSGSLTAVQSSAEKTEKSVKESGKAAKTAGGRFRFFSDALEAVNRRAHQFAAFVIAAAAVQGLSRALTGAIRVIGQYDQALQNLQAILDITVSQASILGDKIQDVSRRTKFSAQEVDRKSVV